MEEFLDPCSNNTELEGKRVLFRALREDIVIQMLDAYLSVSHSTQIALLQNTHTHTAKSYTAEECKSEVLPVL
jgi:hypothetical protein